MLDAFDGGSVPHCPAAAGEGNVAVFFILRCARGGQILIPDMLKGSTECYSVFENFRNT